MRRLTSGESFRDAVRPAGVTGQGRVLAADSVRFTASRCASTGLPNSPTNGSAIAHARAKATRTACVMNLVYLTVTTDEPLLPSDVAVIVTVPLLVVEVTTRPELFTVARDTLFEAHVTTRPVSTLPFASFNVAVN